MLFTEAEAREKWCPMVRIARREDKDTGGECFRHMPSELVGGVNTDALGKNRVPASCRCIASDCMMWRAEKERPLMRMRWLPKSVPGRPLIIGREPGPEHRPALMPADGVWWDEEDEDGPAWIETESHFEERKLAAKAASKGYCGLAGKAK